ncbi:MAG: DUF4031 domain-containing protein [Propionibacteriaceae bacterium]|nr:DUF4031 domain-containing protein [Propionibacteriaceae bacterium]
MIWMDEPRWPVPGTVAGCVISDESLWELHDFAWAAGLSVTSFDHDHYELPARLRQRALDAGARLTGPGDLAARLDGSGLRVPPQGRRPDPADGDLLAAWPLDAEIGARVLARWREPHRRYHDVSHLAEVLARLGELAGQVPRPVVLAAWYHDAVYDGIPGQDEEASAALADAELHGAVAAPERAEIVRLIRLTVSHQPGEGDDHGALLCDADLAILAASPGRYHVSLRDIRQEYRHLGRADFLAGRLAVLERLSATRLFHTPEGRLRWADRARANLDAERARLLAGAWLPDPR